MLSKEKEKRVAFLKRTDEIQMKIAAHTQSIVEFVVQIGKQTVGNVRAAEKDGLHQLQLMSKQISAILEAKPEISIFKPTNSIVLESFKTLPLPSSFTLTDFQPQHINEEFELGKQSVLQRNTFRPKVITRSVVS